jgi:hypothetical protein
MNTHDTSGRVQKDAQSADTHTHLGIRNKISQRHILAVHVHSDYAPTPSQQFALKTPSMRSWCVCEGVKTDWRA